MCKVLGHSLREVFRAGAYSFGGAMSGYCGSDGTELGLGLHHEVHDLEQGRVLPERNGDAGRMHSVSLGKNWRMSAWLWRLHFPGHRIEDANT